MQNPERSAVESFDPEFQIGLGEKALDRHCLQLLSNRQGFVDEATLLVKQSAEVDHVAPVADTYRFLSPSLTLLSEHLVQVARVVPRPKHSCNGGEVLVPGPASHNRSTISA